MNYHPGNSAGKEKTESAPLRVLLIEDSEVDAELLILELEKGGYQVEYERVETESGLKAAIQTRSWDVVLSDYSLPGFDAEAALRVIKAADRNVPFIVVSGKIGEETAVGLMKAGAGDYLKKDSLTRLPQIVSREINEAIIRKENERAREELRLSEERFRSLTELLPVGVYLTDINGQYLYTNQKWLEMTGLNSEEATGDGWMRALHPDDRDNTLAAWQRVIRDGGKMAGEFRVITPEGKITEISGLTNVLLDEHGKQAGYIGVNIDISEQKKADEDLRKSQARLLESQRSAHIGNWEYFPQFRVLNYSEEVMRILGLEDENADRSLDFIISLIKEEERERVLNILHGAFERSEGFDIDVEIQRKNGEIRYVNAKASVGLDPDEKEKKIIGTLQDITPRKVLDLENERLMIEFRRQTEEREAIIDISAHLRVAQTYRELLPILSEESAGISKSDASATVLVDENGLEIASASGFWKDFIGLKFKIPSEAVWQILRDKESVLFTREEVAGLAGLMGIDVHRYLGSLEIISLLPIKAGDSGIGILATGYCDAGKFTKERIDLLKTLTEIAGINMQRMRTMEILEQLVTNRNRELSTIYNVVSVLSESIDITKSLDKVLDQVLTAMEAKYALFFEVNEENTRLNLTAEKGLVPLHRDAIRSLGMNNTWEGWIVNQGEPLVIPNISKDNNMVAPVDFSDGVYSYLGAPMHIHGKVKGVLGVIRKGKAYNVDDILLISAITDHIGLIIENAKLHKQAGQLAIVEERSRLARDLHDSATQTMYSAMLYTETSLNMAERGDTESLVPNLKRLSQLTQQALREMRLLVYELRPSVLEQDGLVAAIRQRLEMVEKRVGISEELIVQDLPALHPGVEMALYRITLEALNNVLKHAEATAVKVEISTTDGFVTLVVTDNGVGFDSKTPKDRGGIGLSSMRERATMLGGEFEIVSNLEQGTVIQVKLPLTGDSKKSIAALEKDLELASSAGKEEMSEEES